MWLVIVLTIAVSVWLCYRQYNHWEQYRDDLSTAELIKTEIGSQLRDLLNADGAIPYKEMVKICALMNLTREPTVRYMVARRKVTITITLRRARVLIELNNESMKNLPVDGYDSL